MRFASASKSQTFIEAMAMERGRVAVTGASGYVGRVIARTLLDNGREVVTVGRTSCPPCSHLPFDLRKTRSSGIDLDLSGVDALVHCAYDFYVASLNESLQVNREGAKTLVASCKRHGVLRLINISTLSAFDGCRSVYGKTKLEIEKVFADAGGISLRPGLIYGPQLAGMLGAMCKLADNLPTIPLIGSGNYPLYLIHQDLLSKIVMNLIDIPSIPRIDWITVASAIPSSLRTIVTEISSRGNRCRFVPIPWPIVWATLRLGELLGVKSRIKSDSVIGLVFGNAAPRFSDEVLKELGIQIPTVANLSEVKRTLVTDN